MRVPWAPKAPEVVVSPNLNRWINPFLKEQEVIFARYNERNDKSITHFLAKSGAYPHTNEPLSDILNANLNTDGPAMAVTASGDAIVLFAGAGVRDIRAIDVSENANSWGEYKWLAFQNMDYDEFAKRMVNSDTPWSDFPFDLPVSSRAREVFKHGREKEGTYMHDRKLFQELGFAASNADSTGYATNEKAYRRMKKVVSGARVLFYPTDMKAYFENEDLPNGGFRLAYLSNVLDHTRNSNGTSRDFSDERMREVLSPIVDNMDRAGQLLFNFQWGDRAVPGAKSALDHFGYDLRKIKGKAGGCGAMYIAKKKAA